jgi:hypothetical protein
MSISRPPKNIFIFVDVRPMPSQIVFDKPHQEDHIELGGKTRSVFPSRGEVWVGQSWIFSPMGAALVAFFLKSAYINVWCRGHIYTGRSTNDHLYTSPMSCSS